MIRLKYLIIYSILVLFTSCLEINLEKNLCKNVLLEFDSCLDLSKSISALHKCVTTANFRQESTNFFTNDDKRTSQSIDTTNKVFEEIDNCENKITDYDFFLCYQKTIKSFSENLLSHGCSKR